jgi:tetratricopeptide (TPR) repeat protein
MARLALLSVVLPAAAALLACGGGGIEGRLAEAHALQDVGQFADSVDPLREVLAEAPDHGEANQMLGMALIQTGQPSLALFPLQRATQDPEYAVSAGILLATTALQLQSYEEAIRAADQVLQIDPDRVAALQVRAHANIGANRYDDAVADTAHLVELNPDDYTSRLMHAVALAESDQLDAAEAEHRAAIEIADKSGVPAMAARACGALANFDKEYRKDPKRAKATYQKCAEEYPTDALILNLASDYMSQLGDEATATAMWKHAMEAAPEEISFRLGYAERLRAQGDTKGAEAALREGVELFGTPQSWQSLADFYRTTGRTADAIQALDEAMAAAGGPNDGLRFVQADLLVENGDLDRAETLAAEFKEPLYRDLIEGRVLLARGDAKGALASFDKAIRLWPDNAGARFEAGRAAQQIGDRERARSEFRESVRANAKATDAALALAMMAYESGDYAEASSFAANFIQNRKPEQSYPYLLRARAETQLGHYKAARTALDEVPKKDGAAAEVVAERANVEQAEKGSQAAIDVIRASGLDLTDPANEKALRALIHAQTELGQLAGALAAADAAVARHPDHAGFEQVRASVLALSGRREEAVASLQKALELDPDDARALGALATVTAQQGDQAKAVELFDRAAATDPSDPAYAYGAAQLSLALGHREDAEARLSALVGAAPALAGPRNDLAYLLADRGADLDRALELALEAQRLDSNPDTLDTLGFVYLKRGESAAAIENFQHALADRPDSPTVLYHLGLALKARGDSGRAIDALEQALAAGDFSDATSARQELAALRQE